MPNSKSTIEVLEKLSIPYQLFKHPPVFTCEESQLLPDMPGKKNKNLFLRDRKGKQYFLISMTQDKQLAIQDLAKKIGEKNLSFASPQRLESVLAVQPGSVGLLALISDQEVQTKVFVDQDLLDEEQIQSHPGVNDATVSFPVTHLQQFLDHTGHQLNAIELR